MCLLGAFACEPEDLLIDEGAAEVGTGGAAEALVYQNDCHAPWDDPFCPSPIITIADRYEALMSGDPIEVEWLVPVTVGGQSFRVMPVVSADSLPTLIVDDGVELWVLTGGGGTVVPDSVLDPIEDGAMGQLTGLLQRDLYDLLGEATPRSQLLNEFAANDAGQVILDDLLGATPPTGVYGLARNCRWERQSSVGLFLRQFFREGVDIPDLRNLVDEAYESCPKVYAGGESRRCAPQCVEPTCVVDYIDALPSIQASDYTEALVKARFLATLVGAEDGAYDGLALSSTRADLDGIYEGWRTFDLPCSASICGVKDGVQMLAEFTLQYPAFVLLERHTRNLYNAVAGLACANPTLYECARVRMETEEDLTPFFIEIDELLPSAALGIVQGYCPSQVTDGPIFFPEEVQLPQQVPIQGPEDPSLEVRLFADGVGGCTFAQALGETEDRNTLEDLEFGFSVTNGQDVRFAEPRSLSGVTSPPTILSLSLRMRALLTAASIAGGLDGVANDAVDLFLNNTTTNTVFEREELNEAVAESHNMINFVTRVADAFQDQLIMGKLFQKFS